LSFNYLSAKDAKGAKKMMVAWFRSLMPAVFYAGVVLIGLDDLSAEDAEDAEIMWLLAVY